MFKSSVRSRVQAYIRSNAHVPRAWGISCTGSNDVLVRSLGKVAGEVEGENRGCKIKLIIFVGGTCGSVHAQTFRDNLKELGVVESKRNTIRKRLVHDLLNV